MKTTRITLLALLLLGLAAGAASAQTSISAGIHVGPSGRASVDLGFFYDDLASYGNWIQRPSYGWVWTPRSVSASWRPYQDGHWVWTDQGWTWVTDEPYGWATYHYGRWYDDPEIGWSWVPGDEWGPSWVSWQEGDDYIGWAPLPPSVTVSFGGLLSVTLAPEAYVFVPERYFLAPRIVTYVVPETRVRTFWGRTHNFTRYRQSGDRIYNDGVPVEQVQRFVGRPVPRYQLGDLSANNRRGGARIQGNRVEIFRPQVQRANVQPPPSRPAARRAVVDAAQFRQSHPDRAGRRAAAQGTSAPEVQPAPAPRPGRQPRTGQAPPAVQGQQPADQARRPRGRGQERPEVTPPGRQRQVQPPPDQTERQRPPKQERPPQAQEKRQRPPQDNPPPQRQPRQVEPQKQRQQQPPPPQQQQKQQRQQEKKKDKEKQQEEHKPPQR
ncbi:MAG TPA: DUF6600 domain-containing protein [Thermoanaerobaculia bacterium]|nr:DUF6600 domain-containing protein [Thermoanaerobaculia bacterium]